MTDPAPANKTEKAPEDLAWSEVPAALGFAIFKQLPNALFRPTGRLPDWLNIPQEPPEPPENPDLASDGIDLAGHFPLIELFLSECEPAWESGSGLPMESDIWTEPGRDGEERYLQAVALLSGGVRFLAVRALPQVLVTYQQFAHDLELAKGKVERMSRDLRELNRELEARKQEADRATQAKSNFLATMSHEIRTPLNAIIGTADILSGTHLTPEQKKCVDVSQRNGVGLLNLINDILDLSKVESGKVELETTGFELRDVIEKALEVIELRSAAKGLWLRQEIAPVLPRFLSGDPNRLRQVIINLLGNSIKFTEHGGLEVRVEPDPEDSQPGSLRFAISDTGIGIPADKIGLIFESFSQADSSTTRKYGGTGLGLTISKQLVELMGGRIWVESTVGQGSTFFFTVKLGVQADQARESTSQKESREAVPAAAWEGLFSGCGILLADDSEDNRFLIESYLKPTKASVDVAENGAVAAALFRSRHYDLVLMDVEMPVMDGYTALGEIRRFEQQSGAAPTPVLALTAHAFSEMAGKSLAAGFTHHLTKPIRKATLLEAVAGYVSRAVPLARRTPDAAPDVVPDAAPDAAPAVASDTVSGALPSAAPGAPPRVAPRSAARIIVKVESGMEDLMAPYLQKKRAELSQYRDALQRQDLDTLRALGHKLKGSGGGYGFPELTSLGAAIEQAAAQKDESALRAKVDELAHYLESVELG